MAQPTGAGAFFSYRGRIGRGFYVLGFAVELVVLFLGLVSLAGLNNPTGGGSFSFLIICGVVAFWIHTMIVVNRLRDAGLAPFYYVIFALGPFVWLWAIEYVLDSAGPSVGNGDEIWLLVLLPPLAFVVVPAFLSSKPPVDAPAV